MRRGGGRALSTTLRTRFTLGGAAAVALLVALIGLIDRGRVDAFAQVDRRLETAAQAATPALAAAAAEPASAATLARTGGDVGIAIVPPTGDPVRLAALPVTLPSPDVAGFSTVGDGGRRWRVFTVTVDARQRSALAAPVALQFATSLDGAERLAAESARGVLLGGALMVVFAAVLSFVVGSVAARPLRLLRDATVHLRDGGRVPTDQRVEEAHELAQAVNVLLDRVDEQQARTASALEAARGFAANAAHELRTPLTSISANLDVLATYPALDAGERATVVVELRHDLDRLLSLLGALRELARGDLQPAEVRRSVDLTEIAEEVVQSARRRHGDADVALVAPSELVVDGWPDGLRLLLDNLVENALVHGAPPVRVALAQEDGTAVITVDDAGHGIPPSQRQLVFGRFTRGRTDTSGTGLGLALVAQQVRLHSGTVTVQDALTGGARIVVTLPAHGADATAPDNAPSRPR